MKQNTFESNGQPIIKKSIKHRLIWRLSLLVIVVILGVTVTIGYPFYQLLNQNLLQGLRGQSHQSLEKLEHDLEHLKNISERFSRNSFVVNSLIDAQGRERYLNILIDDFSKTDELVSVSIVNFNAELIHSNSPMPQQFAEQINLRPALEESKPMILISPWNSQYLIYVMPINYYHSPQGAVITEYDLASVFNNLANLNPGQFSRLFINNQSVHELNYDSDNEYITNHTYQTNLFPILKNLNISLELGIEKQQYFKPLQTIIEHLFLLTIGVIILAVYLGIRLGRVITRPIIELCYKISHSKTDTLQHYYPLGTNDELEQLAYAFDLQTDALIEAQTNLEDKIEIQTADIKSQKIELERSNKELDNFAYIASHDLKAPLRGINQLAHWIEEDLDDKNEVENHLALLKKRTQRMEKLLDDLLEYSRIGKLENQWKTVDSGQLVRQSFDLSAAPAEFNLLIPQTLPIFETLAVPFELIVRNLIDNAIKHHHKQKGRIEVYYEDLGHCFLFQFKDDGPGIDKKFHQKIFQIFQTLKPRDQVEGSGMGLAMIKKTVETYGGKISVYSNKDDGCSFHLKWPKKRALMKFYQMHSRVYQ